MYIEIPVPPNFNCMDYISFEQIKGAKKPNPFNHALTKEQRKLAWSSSPYKHRRGIYFLMNDVELIYVGKTKKLKQRIVSHHQDVIDEKEFDGLYFLSVEDELEMDILEIIYIDMFKPKYNR